MLLILYSIYHASVYIQGLLNGEKMVRKKMVEKWILNGFHFDKGTGSPQDLHGGLGFSTGSV